MAFPLTYFLENFKAPSNQVTFTWTDHQTEEPSDSIQIDPLYFAAISSVYRSIPHCNVFEVNKRNTIMRSKAKNCFLIMLPEFDDWLESGGSIIIDDDCYYADEKWGLNDLYQASELCNFLGIRAANINMFDYIINSPSAYTIVPYHQMFLKTNCEAGIMICEEIFRDMYSADPLKGSAWKSNKKVRYHYNENYRCIVQAYINFAQNAFSMDEITKNFMKEQLGWTDEEERFGVQISLSNWSTVME